MAKNQAFNLIIREDDNQLFISTVYGVLNISHIFEVEDCTEENKIVAKLNLSAKAIKWTGVE